MLEHVVQGSCRCLNPANMEGQVLWALGNLIQCGNLAHDRQVVTVGYLWCFLTHINFLTDNPRIKVVTLLFTGIYEWSAVLLFCRECLE